MEWLINKRLEANLTQTEVARKAKITVSHYNFIENHKRRPSPEVAKRIARILGFEEEWYRLLDEKSA